MEELVEFEYVGFHPYRLKKDDEYYKKEIAFVEAINEELRLNSSFLARVVKRDVDSPYLDENELKVAMSVIQWLGTPVGQGFLEKVNSKI